MKLRLLVRFRLDSSSWGWWRATAGKSEADGRWASRPEWTVVLRRGSALGRHQARDQRESSHKAGRLEQSPGPKGEVKGALPFTPAPLYKPEFQAKVKDLIDHESRTDPVFYCGGRECRASDRRARSCNRQTK